MSLAKLLIATCCNVSFVFAVCAADPLEQLDSYLQLPRDARGALVDQPFATQPLTRQQADRAVELLAADHTRYLQQTRAPEMEKRVIEIDGLSMRFDVKTFGERPAAGYSLVLSMHGGGGTAARVNDQQWRNQQSLYELEEGIYIAPRAPTDTWNMWHQAHIDTFFTRLIENLIALEGVNSNRVYLTGYSAGGDGVYQLAPRMADQLAASGMMAGHPNETKPDGLRNLPFTLHVGGKDSAYQRNEIAKRWESELDALRQTDPLGYDHWVQVYPDKGHWMDREERAGIRWMLKYDRNLYPQKIVWLQDDVIHTRFYWLRVTPDSNLARTRTVVSHQGNTITVEETPVNKLTFLLNDHLVDLDQEIIVRKDQQELFRGMVPRTMTALANTLYERGDPQATFSAELQVEIAR